MSILAEFEQHYDLADRRRSPRRSLKLEAANAPLSAPERGVIIHDLSLTGLLIETSASLKVGEHIRIQIPEAGEVEAEFVWNSGSLYGCRFKKPISKAALSAALLKSPALNFEESTQVADALAELRMLRSTVGRLTATVDGLKGEPGDQPQTVANTETLPVGDEEADELDTRLSFGMRLRVILALSLGSWALILWALGVF